MALPILLYCAWLYACALAALTAQSSLAPLPASMSIPKPAAATDAPYEKADRVREAEVYNMSRVAPGRIASIVNIHNPSIEVHRVEAAINTGAVVIVVAGGGHNTLNVGTEGADFMPYFYNYGVNTVILRNRLRKDGYDARTDAVHDALQGIRMVRANAKEWGYDPAKIGIMVFSAGAELASSAAVEYEAFDKRLPATLSETSRRGRISPIIYPGPTPFARNRTAPAIPGNVSPAFLATPGSGDRIHAIRAMDYFWAMPHRGRSEHRDARIRQRTASGRSVA
jgi:endo-1,4-beta-xylanase